MKHLHDQDFVHLDIKVRTACILSLNLLMFPTVCFWLSFSQGVVTLQEVYKHSCCLLIVLNKPDAERYIFIIF